MLARFAAYRISLKELWLSLADWTRGALARVLFIACQAWVATLEIGVEASFNDVDPITEGSVGEDLDS
jgi:hypothetical protein